MIDLRFVFAHGLWVFGAATLLAAFGYYDWQSREQGRRHRDVMRDARGWKLCVAASVLLAASGVLLMRDIRWWERGLGLVVLAGAVRDLWLTVRAK